MGYLGASLTGVGTGYLIEKIGWNAGFYFWIFGAIFAAIMTLLIWIYKERAIGTVLSQRAPIKL
jgi:sugar phosphate permease